MSVPPTVLILHTLTSLYLFSRTCCGSLLSDGFFTVLTVPSLAVFSCFSPCVICVPVFPRFTVNLNINFCKNIPEGVEGAESYLCDVHARSPGTLLRASPTFCPSYEPGFGHYTQNRIYAIACEQARAYLTPYNHNSQHGVHIEHTFTRVLQVH